MTGRGFSALCFGAVMLAVALSIGNTGAFLLGIVTLTAWGFALLSVLLARLTCRVTQEIAGEQALRGVPCAYHLTTFMLSPFPIAPLFLRMALPSGRQSEFTLSVHSMGKSAGERQFSCPHVGVFPVGITRIRFTDCFGFFRFSRRLRGPLPKLAVLPNPAQTELPPFNPGEGESNAVQRALADQTTPADTRTWQEGDELKRIHWKLSMRRQELMVRTYETPQRPDALIMLDSTPPEATPRARAAVIDAMMEGCAGIAKRMLDSGHPVHLSLSAARELTVQHDHEFMSVQRALAQMATETGDPKNLARANPTDFARDLMAAVRRIRRTGAIVLLTSRLTPVIADAIIALRKTGTPTRLMLYTEGPLSDEQKKLIHLLRVSAVETAHTALH